MPHFSVSSGISFPKSVGESESAVAPRSVSRTLIFRIAKTRTDLLVELVDDLGRRIPLCAEAPVHSRGCVRRRVTPQIFCGAVVGPLAKIPTRSKLGTFFWYCRCQYGRAESARR